MVHRTATALSYASDDDAPRVIANGKDLLADQIVQIAEKYGLEIVKDPILADILSDTEIGSCIPPEAYESVAVIFAFLEQGIRENWL